MKKILILLVAAFALALAVESAFAQGRFQRRLNEVPVDAAVDSDDTSRLGSRIDRMRASLGRGEVADTAVDSEPQRRLGNRIDRMRANFGRGGVPSDNTIEVFRPALCGDYRSIGFVCADNFEAPGDDYILVRNYLGRYYWQQVCE